MAYNFKYTKISLLIYAGKHCLYKKKRENIKTTVLSAGQYNGLYINIAVIYMYISQSTMCYYIYWWMQSAYPFLCKIKILWIYRDRINANKHVKSI